LFNFIAIFLTKRQCNESPKQNTSPARRTLAAIKMKKSVSKSKKINTLKNA